MFSKGVAALGVSSNYNPATPNSRGMAELSVEGIHSVFCILALLFSEHTHFMYWKYPQFEMLHKFSILVKSGIHNTHIGLIAVLELIYSYPSERDYSLEYWVNLANLYYAQYDASLVSGHANIMTWSRNGVVSAWKVHFSSNFEGKAVNRSFAFKKYGGKDEALKLAVQYRNSCLASLLNDALSS